MQQTNHFHTKYLCSLSHTTNSLFHVMWRIQTLIMINISESENLIMECNSNIQVRLKLSNSPPLFRLSKILYQVYHIWSK